VGFKSADGVRRDFTGAEVYTARFISHRDQDFVQPTSQDGNRAAEVMPENKTEVGKLL